MSSLGEDYPVQQARCRRLLEQYQAIGPAGAFGRAMISDVLKQADEAAVSGDAVAMIRAYEAMAGCE